MNLKKVTKKRFEAWAKQLPEDRTFNYYNGQKCVIASFLKESEGCRKDMAVGGTKIFIGNGQVRIFPRWLQNISEYCGRCAPIVTKQNILKSLSFRNR